MSNLSPNTRMGIENVIDEVLKSPNIFSEMVEEKHAKFGIEPTLECVLSYLSGSLTGIVLHHQGHLQKTNYTMFHEVLDEADDLIARRMWELRQAIIRDSYK